MGCKADFAVNSTAIGKKFNARHVALPPETGQSRTARRYAEGPHHAQRQSAAKIIHYIINSKLSIQDVGKVPFLLSNITFGAF